MMIYMYKNAGDYARARKLFAQMSERGIPLSTVTFNSLMSFETDYKEVSSVYDQVSSHLIAQKISVELRCCRLKKYMIINIYNPYMCHKFRCKEPG